MIQKINSIEEYKKTYKESIENPGIFWDKVADGFIWKKRAEKFNTGDFHNVNFKWFEDSELNITENCLDRHLDSI